MINKVYGEFHPSIVEDHPEMIDKIVDGELLSRSKYLKRLGPVEISTRQHAYFNHDGNRYLVCVPITPYLPLLCRCESDIIVGKPDASPPPRGMLYGVTMWC